MNTNTTYEIHLAEIEEHIQNDNLELACKLMSDITLAKMLDNMAIEDATEEDAKNAVEKSNYYLNLSGFLCALNLPINNQHLSFVKFNQSNIKMLETQSVPLPPDLPDEIIAITNGFLHGLKHKIQKIQSQHKVISGAPPAANF